MQGNCTSDPTTALKNASRLSLTNVRQGSCVIVTDVRFLEVYQNLWLDSLHFSHVNTRRTDTSAVLWCGSQACNLWITNVTFQGQGRNDPPNGALAVSGGQVYAEGVYAANCANTLSIAIYHPENRANNSGDFMFYMPV